MMNITATSRRVLSIQSHVVSGYVGNKAAVFPLQLLGFDVDVINSVQFSNHKGYKGGAPGSVTQGEQVVDLLLGLERNDLLRNVGHLLTGYMGSESFLEAVINWVERVKQQQRLVFVCDPVLGDDGKFYVPTEFVDLYRRRVIPMADVVTPNQFEAEQLTGIMVSTLLDAKNACRLLHDMGPSLVVITSLRHLRCDITGETQHENNDDDDDEQHTISILASQRHANNKTITFWLITCPWIPGTFAGAGDLFASLFLAHSSREELFVALEKAVNTLYAVILKTREYAQSLGDAAANTSSSLAQELQLIQSQQDILNPPTRFKAVRI